MKLRVSWAISRSRVKAACSGARFDAVDGPVRSQLPSQAEVVEGLAEKVREAEQRCGGAAGLEKAYMARSADTPMLE